MTNLARIKAFCFGVLVGCLMVLLINQWILPHEGFPSIQTLAVLGSAGFVLCLILESRR